MKSLVMWFRTSQGFLSLLNSWKCENGISTLTRWNRTWGEYTIFERYIHVFAEMVRGRWSQFSWRIGWRRRICLGLVRMVTLCWFKIYSLKCVDIWNVVCDYCWDNVVEYWIFTVFEKYLVLKLCDVIWMPLVVIVIYFSMQMVWSRWYCISCFGFWIQFRHD